MLELTDAPRLMFPAGTSIPNQVLFTNEIFSMVLPRAVGGVAPLVYNIRNPDNDANVTTGAPIPAGLTYTPASRLLSGVPTTVTNRAVVRYPGLRIMSLIPLHPPLLLICFLRLKLDLVLRGPYLR